MYNCYGVEVRKKRFYCSHACIRDDEMNNTGYPFKCVTRYGDEDFLLFK